MIKTTEQASRLKLSICDEVARNPLVSVVQLQNSLKMRGFQTANGNPLAWRYVAELVRKLNREKALAVDTQRINERLAITKESYRIISERLWKIITGDGEFFPPSNDEIVRAANSLIKLDLAILKAEMDAGIFDRKLGSVDLNVYRAAPLDPERAALIADAFKKWGITLELPRQGPVTEQANAEPAALGGQGVPGTP